MVVHQPREQKIPGCIGEMILELVVADIRQIIVCATLTVVKQDVQSAGSPNDFGKALAERRIIFVVKLNSDVVCAFAAWQLIDRVFRSLQVAAGNYNRRSGLRERSTDRGSLSIPLRRLPRQLGQRDQTVCATVGSRFAASFMVDPRYSRNRLPSSCVSGFQDSEIHAQRLFTLV